MAVNVYGIDGSVKGSMELPRAFSEPVRTDLILRAIHAEDSYKHQPQGRFVEAGMQTSAAYFGRMHEYRSGRHMGIAIRPREKLGGGVQGKVKRIPSATKGRRAHPHKVEKIITERINTKEYQKAIASAISASVSKKSAVASPMVVANAIESVKKTKEMLQILGKLKLSALVSQSHAPRISTSRRYAVRRHFRNALLFVTSKDCDAIKAARNIPGVEVCTIEGLTAGKLAPGGSGIAALWSEDAVRDVEKSIARLSLRK